MWSPNEDFEESVPGIRGSGALVRRKLDNILTDICNKGSAAARINAEIKSPGPPKGQ